MQLIKLDAIDSTNEFLKGLSSNQLLENFTVVTAEIQTKGKGQMGAVWDSEPSKNLIMSVLITDFVTDINQIFDVNIAISLAVIKALEDFDIPELSIKWPNDIMSYHKKIGGILIENTIKSDGSINSIVGLGLNINQMNFENLPKASSLAVMGGVYK
jgi:BirA family biotin operon repressor/biotin-[acetyl-CoA-carboxylase] ligase